MIYSPFLPLSSADLLRPSLVVPQWPPPECVAKWRSTGTLTDAYRRVKCCRGPSVCVSTDGAGAKDLPRAFFMDRQRICFLLHCIQLLRRRIEHGNSGGEEMRLIRLIHGHCGASGDCTGPLRPLDQLQTHNHQSSSICPRIKS